MRGGPKAPRTGRTVPLGRGELAIHRPPVFGDLISYQSDGESCTLIASKAARA
jgi:hypothetical protein